jgi:tetratricopeptide (TPR) repeat protein
VTTSADSHFTLSRVQELLGISRSVISGLINAGFVVPTKGARRQQQFSFQDLMLLRTAYSLQQANIPPRKILGSLRRLKEDLPQELPLTGLRITAIGSDVVVRSRDGDWAAESGQLLMDFEVAPLESSIAFMAYPTQAQTNTPETWLLRGQALETTDPLEAEIAYRCALNLNPDYLDAYLNLGAFLCRLDRSGEAVDLYEGAMSQWPDSAYLLFNHAIALEDQGRLQDAVKIYERCIANDAFFADAHYNLGILLEQLGEGRGHYYTSVPTGGSRFKLVASMSCRQVFVEH